MSARLSSRADASLPPSLADVLRALASADLTKRRRQDLTSAVRSAARAIGRPPEQIPADPRLLASRLAEVAPQALELSKGRWNNVRSLLRTGVELVVPISPGRHVTLLTPTWHSLRSRIQSQALRTRLSRLMHFCSAAGIEPECISEATFSSFRQHLETTLLKNPMGAFREAVRAWNAARAEVAGWPDLAISVPSRRKTWTQSWDSFPESLRRDVSAYLDRLAGRDPFEEVAFRPVRPLTLRNREYQLRQFASALVLSGRDPATLTNLGDLVTIEAFKDGLRFLLGRRANKPSGGIADLATGLKAIARHHVRADERHLAQMSAIIRRLQKPRSGLTEKNRSRLRALDDTSKLLALVQLPGKLLDLAERQQKPRKAALLAQMAVAIEVLLMAPLRISNLANLDIELHLVRPNRASRNLHIVIPENEVKNGEPLEYPLPPESVVLIERYLARHRPALASPACTALFPGRSAAKSISTLRQQLIRTVYAHTGLKVHPHLFRQIATKLLLDANPGEYEVARRLLGHSSIETTTAFYAGLEMAAAVRHYDRTILQLRQGGNRT